MAQYLSELLDVNIPSPINKQSLIYNSSTAKWDSVSPDISYISSFAINSPVDKQILTYDVGTTKWVNTTNNTSALSDVAISSPTNNQVLAYNTSTSKWVNKSQTISDIVDFTVSYPQDQQFLTYNSTTGKWFNDPNLNAKNIVNLETVIHDIAVYWPSTTPTKQLHWTKTGDDIDSTLLVSDNDIIITAGPGGYKSSSWSHRYGQTPDVSLSAKFTFDGTFSPTVLISRGSDTVGYACKIDKTTKHITLTAMDMTTLLLDELVDFITVGQPYTLQVNRYNGSCYILIYDETYAVVRYTRLINIGRLYDVSFPGQNIGISGLGSDGVATYSNFSTHVLISPIYYIYYGDQNNMGYNLANPGYAHPYLFKKYSLDYDLFVTNIGYQNATSQTLLNNYLHDITPIIFYPNITSVVIIFIGQNDIENGVAPETIIFNIATMVATLKPFGTYVWVATNYPRTDNIAYNDQLRKLATLIRAKSNASRIIDTWNILADPDNDNACLPGYLQADGKNLTEYGQVKVFALIYEHMRKMISNQVIISSRYE